MSIIRNELKHKIINENDLVSITVKIGDRQYLYSNLLYTPDGTYHNGSIKDTVMGLGKDLKNKESFLTVMVTDANPNTNWTSITVELTNGEIKIPYSGLSDIDNGTVIYIITIKHE